MFSKIVNNTRFFIFNKDNMARIFYVVTGVILLVFLVVTFNTYVMRLKVETAVVSAPIETMVSPVSGYISNVYVVPGQVVKKGDILLKIENMYLERKLHLARVQVDESKLNVEYYKQLLTNELQRLKLYQKIGRHRVISAQSMVNVSKQDVLTAQQTFERLSALHAKHYVSKAVLEATQAKFISAQEKLKKAKAQRNVEKQSLKHAVNKGVYFSGTKTEGISRDLIAELVVAQKRIILNEERVKIYEKLINQLTLIAPFDGKVVQVLKSAGNTTDNIKPVILVEKTGESKSIVAYLTQSEVTHIGASNEIKIYVPSSDKIYHGKLNVINRTDGFIDEIKAQYRWRDFQADRSAMVSIVIKPQDQSAFDKEAFPGMPAVVYFSKKM